MTTRKFNINHILVSAVVSVSGVTTACQNGNIIITTFPEICDGDGFGERGKIKPSAFKFNWACARSGGARRRVGRTMHLQRAFILYSTIHCKLLLLFYCNTRQYAIIIMYIILFCARKILENISDYNIHLPL